jgi:outer membrane biosynthesis protein TonB
LLQQLLFSPAAAVCLGLSAHDALAVVFSEQQDFFATTAVSLLSAQALASPASSEQQDFFSAFAMAP